MMPDEKAARLAGSRRWRRALRPVVGFLASVLLAGGLFILWLDSDAGHAWLRDRLNRALADEGVALDGLGGHLWSRPQLAAVTLSDATGPYLRLEDLSLEWRPRALLHGRLDIARLAIARGRLLRRPEAATAADDTVALPVVEAGLVIADLSLARLDVPETVFGVAASLSAAGRLRLVPGARFEAALTVDRVDRRGTDRAAIAVDYRPAGRVLGLRMTLEGRTGGLFAAAFGDAVALDLAGDGPLATWRGDLGAQIGAGTRLAARIVAQDGGVEVTGTASPGERGPRSLESLLAPEIGFRLHGERRPDKRIVLGGTAHSGTGTLRLTAIVDPKDLARLDVALEATLANPQALRRLLAPVEIGAAALDGRVTGTLAAPRFDGRLVLTDARRPDDIAIDTLTAQVATAAGPADVTFEAAGDAEEIVIGDRAFDRLTYRLVGSVDRGSDGITLASSLIEGQALRLAVTGTVSPRRSAFALRTEIADADLALLFPAAGIEGRFEGEVTASREGRVSPIRGRADLAFSSFASGRAAIDRVLDAAPRLRTDFELSADRTLAIRGFRLRGRHAGLDGEGRLTLDGSAIALGYRLSIDDLGALLDGDRLTLAGRTILEGDLDGSMAALGFRLRSRIGKLDLQGAELHDLAVRLDGENLLGAAHGRLRLAGESAFGPLVVETGLALRSDRGIALEGFRVDLGALRLAGDLDIGPDGLLRGDISSTQVDLATVAATPARGLQGDVELRLVLSAADGAQAFDATARGTAISAPLTASDVLKVGALSFRARGQLGPSPPRFEVDSVMSGLTIGLARIERAEITAQKGTTPLKLRAHVAGSWYGALDLDGSLEVAPSATAATEARIALAGTLFGAPLTLRAPARLQLAPGDWRLDPVHVDLADGGLDIAAARGADRARLQLVLDGLPLEFANRFTARPLPRGRINADLALVQESGDSHGSLVIALDDLRPLVGSLTPLPPVSLQLGGQLADGRLTLEAQAAADGQASGSLRLTLPLRLDLVAGTLSTDPDAPVAGRLEWSGALAPIFALSGEKALGAGDLRVSIDVAGRLRAPEFLGEMSLSRGRFEHVKSGFVAEDIVVEADLSDRRLRIRRLGASDGNGGEITGEGRIEWDEAGTIGADLSLDLGAVQVLRQAGLQARVSGPLHYVRTAGGDLLSGQLAADRVEFDIARKVPDDLVTIDVVEIHGDAPSAPIDGHGDDARPRLLLDLRAEAPRRLFVTGRGLDSEWGADLRITGPAARPQVAGTARLIKGSFDFLGRRFDFSEGTLLFDGGDRIDPVVHLVARQVAEGLQVTLTLDGPVSKPTIRLASAPALPEDEIVARLLFGASTASLTPIEGLELASALAGLAGGSSFDIIGNARGLLGLDRLSLAPGSENAAAPRVAGGKYLSDRVYFEVATDTGTGAAEGLLEWSLTRNLSIASRVRSDQESSIRVRWSWSY